MSVAVLEYLGFQNTPESREYRLRSRSGTQHQEYTVEIAHRAFASGRARYQDGPAICYEKLQRELSAEPPPLTHHFEVSEEELVAYQQSHAQGQKRWHAPDSLPREGEHAAGSQQQAGPPEEER